MVLNITKKELLLALFITALGYYFSSRNTLLSLNKLTPIQLLLISYIVLFGSLLYLAKHGLVIWKLRIEHPLQVVGTTMIWFAFFLTMSMENPYVQYTTQGNFEGASNVFYGTEDAVTWTFWTGYISPIPENIEKLRLLTFVFTPAILTLVGALLVNGKISY